MTQDATSLAAELVRGEVMAWNASTRVASYRACYSVEGMGEGCSLENSPSDSSAMELWLPSETGERADEEAAMARALERVSARIEGQTLVRIAATIWPDKKQKVVLSGITVTIKKNVLVVVAQFPRRQIRRKIVVDRRWTPIPERVFFLRGEVLGVEIRNDPGNAYLEGLNTNWKLEIFDLRSGARATDNERRITRHSS